MRLLLSSITLDATTDGLLDRLIHVVAEWCLALAEPLLVGTPAN
jgi:hypothetical protein